MLRTQHFTPTFLPLSASVFAPPQSIRQISRCCNDNFLLPLSVQATEMGGKIVAFAKKRGREEVFPGFSSSSSLPSPTTLNNSESEFCYSPPHPFLALNSPEKDPRRSDPSINHCVTFGSVNRGGCCFRTSGKQALFFWHLRRKWIIKSRGSTWQEKATSASRRILT